ncbi:MAG: ABC transporter ATP-binding protein, partial [Lachnospiraceae bacterium]|nr:ABC transporter ATP-binding protein [Lachnospiraceae bacterium]
MVQIKWLLDNLKGYRKKYIAALFLSVLCNILYITSPYFQSRIVDTFISNEHAAENLLQKRSLLLWLIAGMIFFTVVRVCFQYTCNMYYETASQGMIYRIRTSLFRHIENQDMEFYDTFRTGDLMTRMTGDLDLCRHMVSCVIKGVVESAALF